MPVLVIWVGLVAKRKGSLKLVLLSIFTLLLVYCVVITPVTVRNYLVNDDFVLISANLGVNFLIGNSPNAKGEFVAFYVPGKGTFGSCYDYHIITDVLEKKMGKNLKYSEVSRHLVRIAIEGIKANPKESAKLTLKKAYLFWSPRELPHNKDIQVMRHSYLTLRIIPLNFPAILSSSLVGFILLIFDFKSKDKFMATSILVKDASSVCLCFVLFMLIYYISYIPFFASALYRVPLIPFLMLFSAYAVHKIYLYTIKKETHKILVIIVSILCLFGVFSIDFYPPIDHAEVDFDDGVMCLVYGRLDDAADQFRKVLDLEPNNAKAYYGLGVISFSRSEFEQAAEYYKKSLEIKPDFAAACDNLGSVLIRMDKIPEGIKYILQGIELSSGKLVENNLAVSFLPKYYEYYLYSGNLLAQRGQIEEAITLFKMANIMEPDSSETNYMLGKALLQEKRVDQAITLLQNAVVLDANQADTFFMLGKALSEKEKFGLAERHYRKSIELNPNHPEVHRELEGVLLKQGKAVESKKYREEFLKKQSDKK